MQIETKYSIGDCVVVIHRTRVQLPPETCSACEGTGHVDLRGAEYHCPKCNGKKTTQAAGSGWVICDAGEIRHIDAEHRHQVPDYPGDYGDECLCTVVKYMFSGNGCGSVYQESSLWPTREAAQAECDRRNDYEREKERAA